MRGIVWLRRDLRLDDHHAFYAAAKRCEEVVAAFVLDPVLLRSERVGAPIVQCFFDALRALRSDLRAMSSDLALLEGGCAEQLIALARRVGAEAVFYNVDYEPAAIRRDATATQTLRNAGLDVHAFLDHVYFGADELQRADGGAFRTFTPYKRAWLDRRALQPRLPFASRRSIAPRLAAAAEISTTLCVPSPEDWGYASSPAYPQAGETLARELLEDFFDSALASYRRDRDFPAVGGTSMLSPQLRAGTIGIRTCVEAAFAYLRENDKKAQDGAATWISELIWRDFYQMVLATWPHVATDPFVSSASTIQWRTSGPEFAAWCEGRTGIPIVDAAMRQLNTTGWMHNRLRMVVASFLTKDLLMDWRLGERYFEQRLADGDLAANNGGWQWTAGTGTDAAPYFRIFNPVLQSRRFDPEGDFIRSMIPELAAVPAPYIHAPWEMPPLIAAEAHCRLGIDYPSPIVDHAAARTRAMQALAPLRSQKAPS